MAYTKHSTISKTRVFHQIHTFGTFTLSNDSYKISNQTHEKIIIHVNRAHQCTGSLHCAGALVHTMATYLCPFVSLTSYSSFTSVRPSSQSSRTHSVHKINSASPIERSLTLKVIQVKVSEARGSRSRGQHEICALLLSMMKDDNCLMDLLDRVRSPKMRLKILLFFLRYLRAEKTTCSNTCCRPSWLRAEHSM